MRAFSNFLRAKRGKSGPGLSQFVFRNFDSGVARLVQTKLTDGSDVPDFIISQTGGLFSTESTAQGFFLNLDHAQFDADYADFQTSLAVEPVLSPESVAAGATIGDMTNATATDQANVSAILTLKAVLSMG